MNYRFTLKLLAISTLLLQINTFGGSLLLCSYEAQYLIGLKSAHPISHSQTIELFLIFVSHLSLLLLPALLWFRYFKLILVIIPALFFACFIFISGILNFAFIICLLLWLYASWQYIQEEREYKEHRDIEL